MPTKQNTSANPLAFDSEMAQRLEVLYNTRDARRRRSLVLQAVAAASGERIIDIGCGAGFYLSALAEVVGTDGSLVGVDSSAPMLKIAHQRCGGDDHVSLHQADAGALPIDDASIDAALSVQVFEYIKDPAQALAEIHRVLKPGGRTVMWDVDWATISWHSTNPTRMKRILRTWEEHLANPSLPRTLAAHMRQAGFDQVSFAAHPFASAEFDTESYGTAIIPLIQDFTAGRSGVTADDALAWALEQRQLGERGEFFFTCTQFCFQGIKANHRHSTAAKEAEPAEP